MFSALSLQVQGAVADSHGHYNYIPGVIILRHTHQRPISQILKHLPFMCKTSARPSQGDWWQSDKRLKKEKEKEENIWRREIYGLQRKRKTKKEKEENIWSGEEEKTAEGKGGQYFGEGKKEERIGSIFYFKFTFFSNEYSLPCLVVDRMEELIVELMSVENVWCLWESWSFLHLSHRGMVGFGLRRNLGTTGKKHSSLFHLRRSKRYWRWWRWSPIRGRRGPKKGSPPFMQSWRRYVAKLLIFKTLDNMVPLYHCQCNGCINDCIFDCFFTCVLPWIVECR